MGSRAAAAGALCLAMLVAGGCSPDVEATLERAQLELEQGNSEAALEQLRAGLDVEPDHLELNLLYARVLLQSGRPSLAVWSLAKVAADPAHAVEAGLLLARAQLASGSFDDAIVSLERVLEDEPDNAEALRLRAAARLRVSRESRALEDIDRALELSPGDLGLLMARLNALLQLEDSEAASAVMAEIRARIESLEGMPPAQREQLAGRYCVAEASFAHESGEADAAEAAYLGCLEAHPGNPLVVQATVAFLDERGEPERGTEVLRDTLGAQPRNLPLRVRLADRLRARDPAQSERLLREIVAEQPEAWAALADHYIALEQHEAAVDALDQALALHPAVAPPAWSLMRTDLLIQLSRYEEAELAIEALEEPVYQYVTRGRLALERGEPQRALEQLTEGIRLWPDGATARYLAARAAEQLGDFARAESEYREALRAGEGHTRAGLELARLLDSRGLGQEALSAITLYLSHAPDDADAYELAFELARRHAGPQRAQAVLARYRARPTHAQRSLAFSLRGIAQAQGADAAIAALEPLGVDLDDPANAEILAALAHALSSGGRHDEAIARTRAALQASPDHPRLLALHAKSIEASGAAESARQAWQRVLDVDPEHPEALLGLARSARRQSELDSALSLYRRAARAAPEDATPLFELGTLLVGAGRLEEARQHFDQALMRDPRHAAAASALLEDLVERGRVEDARALDLAQRSLRFSEGGDSLAAYLRFRLARGEALEAIRAVQRGGRSAPTTPSVQFLLARALLLAERPQQGAALLHKALAQGSFPERAEAMQLLAELPEPLRETPAGEGEASSG